MKGSYKQTPGKFHLIGHSVGAHGAGDVGSRVPGLARITGKAGPSLELLLCSSAEVTTSPVIMVSG